MSGFRADSEPWVKDFEACKILAQEIVQLIQAGWRGVSHAPM